MASSAILLYPNSWQGMITNSSTTKGKHTFCTSQASLGLVGVDDFTSAPRFFTLHLSADGSLTQVTWQGILLRG
ncbi:hypothetical protein PG999_008477 [Apiospora kogelbergensis]|uniref:Uncharacterized protein n=1 Tax=Apiospora kogelbergensis TaxID=1337665 RepID=A0AAW0QKL7_9PEZI